MSQDLREREREREREMKLERESMKIERQVSVKNRIGQKDSKGFLLSLREVGLVSTGFKFINSQPDPKFRFLKARDPNLTYLAIWAACWASGWAGLLGLVRSQGSLDSPKVYVVLGTPCQHPHGVSKSNEKVTCVPKKTHQHFNLLYNQKTNLSSKFRNPAALSLSSL